MVFSRQMGWICPLLILASGGMAVDFGNSKNNSLVGCNWFGKYDTNDCSSRGSPPHDECNFDVYQYPAIGMKRIEKTEGDKATPNDLVWTQGSTFHNAPDFFKTEYFLSRPFNVPYMFAKTCAVLLRQDVPTLKFPGFDQDPASSTGTCVDAMEQSCIDGILKFATDVVKNTTDSDPCEELRYALFHVVVTQNGTIDGCSNGNDKDFAFGANYYYSMVDLNSQLETFNPSQKVNSGCYPSLWNAEESNIAEIGSYEFIVQTNEETFFDHAYAITPALLVSWLGPNDEYNPTNSRRVASTLTCVKLVDPNHSVNASLQAGKESKESKGTLIAPRPLTAPLVWMISVTLLYLGTLRWE